MPADAPRSDHSFMQERRANDGTDGRATDRHVRVVVWSPFEQLASELRRLIDSSGDARSVELSRQSTLPQAIRDSGAHLAVLDVDSTPGGRGAFIADVHGAATDVSILALSAKCDVRLAASTLSAGANGYVLKDRAFEELLEAVRALAKGARYVSPAVDRHSVELYETEDRSRTALAPVPCEGTVGHRTAANQVRPDSLERRGMIEVQREPRIGTFP